jgi:hypothetical protein
VLLVADHGDAPPSGLHEVRGGRVADVDARDIHVVCRGRGPVLADQHHRGVVAGILQLRRGHRERAEDQRVGEPDREAGRHLTLALDVTVGLLDHHRQPALAGRADQQAREVGEVGHVDARDGQRDRAGAAPAQLSSHGLWPVTQLLDVALDEGARLGPHVDVVVDHVGHGLR